MISISNAALVALLAVSHINIIITHAHAASASASAVTSSESEGTIRNENENSNLVSIDIPNDKDDGNQSIESPFREYTLTDTTFEFNPRHAAWLQKHSLNDWNANHQQQQQQQSNFKSKISNPNSNKIDNNSDNNKIDKIRKEEEIVEAHLRGISYSQQQFDEVEKELEEYARSSSLTRMNSNGLSLFTPLKNQFVNHCAEYLLSDLVLEDELISQVDSTNFLINYCKQVNVCEDEYTTSFHALDFKIQLAFTRFNCPLRQQAPLVSEQECLDELDAQGEEFGKVVTDPNNVVLRQEVVDYCVFLWIFGEDFHGGTQSPTQGPTKGPTVSPSVAPTGGPSVSPTKSPTVSPTDLPSVVPTASPTSSPTKLPSASPTSSPSASPTSSPTASPTKLPSAPPTSSPSAGPTAIPTASPTKLPSASPTASPSASPTEYPSASPSVSPTQNPTQTPTAPPTEVPSPSPTKSPTKLPSVSPTLSQMPSASPTPGPTFIGSFHPSVSVKPSTSPTSTPSASPTSTPTSSPSVSPTSHPSVSPTSTPTSSPSVSPTSTPTSSPSASPTSHPSVSPTSSPSASPTSEPTATPSVSPTASPSSHPSAGPTPSPSNSPTKNPSASPTSVPSVRPTSSPTDVPSASPTSSPTAEPSFTPSVSDAPSSKPSSHPTFLGTWHPSSSQAPSTVPSVSPTATPSTVPSVSPTATPTNSPSNAPSTGPTSTPSVSPTDKPTSSPTNGPSDSPTSEPTSLPSTVPTNGPSDSPTSEPTSLPSTVPTKAPSPSPTYIPGHSHRPSGAPSASPTASPTTSPAPSTSIAPSASPTSVRMFKVSFTYILGFEDTEINSRSLDDANRNVDIMDSVRGGLYKVLAFNKILRKRNLRTSATTNMRDLIGFRSDAPEMDNIYHKNVEDEDECPEAFTDSFSCVRIVTEVAVFADPNTYDDASVATEVQEPISAAMSDNFFIDSTGRGEVKEAKYLGGGTVLSGDEVVPAENNRGILTGPGIAGVAVGALFMMFIIGLFAFTRSRAEDDRDDENPELQSNAESYADIDGDMETPRGGGKVNVRSIGESDAYESSSISRAAQFDPETGDVIPPAVSLVSASSSNYDDSDEEGELLIGRLDAAVSAGDWAAVAAIAGDLSTADEASTMSSLHSTKFDNITDRNGLSEEDAKRAVKIDDLITAGDWNAVGATAAAFDSDGSASGSRRSGDIEPRSIGEGGKKKSILDFIAGPWQSSAASKAIVEDGAEADVESLKLDGSQAGGSDGISSLSNGGSPERHVDVDVNMGPSAFPPMMPPPPQSESSATDDDTRAMIGKEDQKRGWRGRIPMIRRKENAEEKIGSKSLALQEDSSVSSWSQGSPESNGIVPYGDRKSQANDNMPAEMRAFGEDYGLAAAELAMRQEEEAMQIDDNDQSEGGLVEEISEKSSNSLRDELDKAIESGDWATVEAQTNKMFDQSFEQLNAETETAARRRKNSMSSFDESDGDEDSREGWSTSSKSQKSDPIDEERIAMLEKLIETDDWQGIVTTSRIHNREDSSMASSSFQDEGMLSLATDREDDDDDDMEDEDLSMATDAKKPLNNA